MSTHRIHVINCGSSSLKFALLEGNALPSEGIFERLGRPEASGRWKIGGASGAGEEIGLAKTAPRAAEGETHTVAIPQKKKPPIGTALNISVNVAKVPGEEKVDNNKATYPALFDQG